MSLIRTQTRMVVPVSETITQSPSAPPDPAFLAVIEAAKQAQAQFTTEELTAMTFVMVSELYETVEKVRPSIERVSTDIAQGGLAGMIGAMMRPGRG